jgi:hypothetical protein
VTTDHPNSSPRGGSAAGHDGTRHYEIRIRGRLEARWNSWFDGLTVHPGPDGTTVIAGPVVDQAALHGVLHRLRDLGIDLLSLTEVLPDPNTDGATAPTNEGN